MPEEASPEQQEQTIMAMGIPQLYNLYCTEFFNGNQIKSEEMERVKFGFKVDFDIRGYIEWEDLIEEKKRGFHESYSGRGIRKFQLIRYIEDIEKIRRHFSKEGLNSDEINKKIPSKYYASIFDYRDELDFRQATMRAVLMSIYGIREFTRGMKNGKDI